MVLSVWIVYLILVTLIWLSRHVVLGRVSRSDAVLDSHRYADRPAPAKRVSVIIAAKDEEAVIERCVRTLLKQDYPNLELIFADDRSRDRTGAILESLRREAPDKVRVVTITELPEGWFGKANAMRTAVAAASGEHFIFSDADCEQTSPRSIRTAVAYALQHEIDFLSVLPNVRPGGFWESIIQPVCSAVLMVWHQPDKVNNPKSKAAYANGAFMLMSREAYVRIGGHEAARNVLLEDIRMAHNAKAAGVKLHVVRNRDLYDTRMYGSFTATCKGWSRIFLGSLLRPGRLLLSLVLVILVSLGPWASMVAAAGGCALSDSESGRSWANVLFAACVAAAAQLSLTMRLYPMMQASRWRALTYPLGALMAVGILVHAWLRMIGVGQTTWHGTTYSVPGRADHNRPSTESAPAHAG